MNFRNEAVENCYIINAKIGRGHFAEVFNCSCKTSGNNYAAKFIRLKRTKASKLGMDLVDIQREADVLRSLNHANIISIRETFVIAGKAILILELVSGGELFEYLSEKERLSEEEASQFVEQILYGVHHMHENEVVHLDLKPENILIEDVATRKIKIVDFGLARRLKPNEVYQGIHGTADYVAPEIINYDPVSFSTDMWSIGVITYMLLTGLSPFGGDNQQETFVNISECNYELYCEEMEDVSDLAKDFIRALLIKNKKLRATASECLKNPWIKPMESEHVQRRRSSLISKDVLRSLKKFTASEAMSHDGESDEMVTPLPHRSRQSLTVNEFRLLPSTPENPDVFKQFSRPTSADSKDDSSCNSSVVGNSLVEREANHEADYRETRLFIVGDSSKYVTDNCDESQHSACCSDLTENFIQATQLTEAAPILQ